MVSGNNSLSCDISDLIVGRSIVDSDGPKVADKFYEYVLQRSASAVPDSQLYPDITRAAHALHVAVAKLRDDNTSFVRWVPFVHFGR